MTSDRTERFNVQKTVQLHNHSFSCNWPATSTCFFNSCIMQKAYHCTFLKKSEGSNLAKPKYTIPLVFNKKTVVSLLE